VSAATATTKSITDRTSGEGDDDYDYDMDTEVEDQLNEENPYSGRSELPPTPLPTSQRKEQSVPAASSQPQLIDTDNDSTDFEGDVVSINRQTDPYPLKRQSVVEKIVQPEPSSGSETDFEPSPSILPAESVPKKRKKVVVFDSEDSD